MTEAQPEPAAPATPQEDRIDTLEKKVDQILGMLTGSGTNPSTSPEPAPADPKAEMRAELAKLQAAERRKAQRDAERQANDSRLKAIEDKIREKPPEEYSKLTNFFGWRDKPKQEKPA